MENCRMLLATHPIPWYHMNIKNLFADIPSDHTQETFETLLEQPNLRLERIVSYGHATPPGRMARTGSG